MKDTEDDLEFVIQTVARIAVGKIDEVTGGIVLSPPPTDKQVAKARASIEKSGGYLWQRNEAGQCQPQSESSASNGAGENVNSGNLAISGK